MTKYHILLFYLPSSDIPNVPENLFLLATLANSCIISVIFCKRYCFRRAKQHSRFYVNSDAVARTAQANLPDGAS